MNEALKMKEKRDAAEEEVTEINEKNFQMIKERCRVDIAKKGERMDFLGRLHKERREAIEEEKILRAKETRELLPKQIEQTRRLAEGVLKLKNKEIWEQKHRQILRDENIELKELESRLKSTYAAKTAQIQLREREARRIEEKYREIQATNIRNRWYNDDRFYKEMEKSEYEKKIKYRNDIQDQLINNELLRRQRTEEEHRERKIVEETSDVIYKENIHIAEEKMNKIAQTQAEMKGFFQAKEIWKCKEKEALLDEFHRESKIIEDKMMEEQNINTIKSDRSTARDFMMEKIARQMLDDEVKKREKEDILDELIAEEANNEFTQSLKKDFLKKEIIKKELLDDMERQKKLVEENKAKEIAADNEFAKYLTREYEISVKNDKEKYEERRRKGIQYGKDLKAIIEEQRALYAEEILARKAIRRQDEEMELQRLNEVSLERSNIFYEHASNLHGFLKPGTLRNEDYEFIKNRKCNLENS